MNFISARSDWGMFFFMLSVRSINESVTIVKGVVPVNPTRAKLDYTDSLLYCIYYFVSETENTVRDWMAVGPMAID